MQMLVFCWVKLTPHNAALSGEMGLTSGKKVKARRVNYVFSLFFCGKRMHTAFSRSTQHIKGEQLCTT